MTADAVARGSQRASATYRRPFSCTAGHHPMFAPLSASAEACPGAPSARDRELR